MKRSISLIIGIISCIPVIAQNDADVGITTGVSYYLGDINLARQFYSSNFYIGGIYRHNFNKRLSVRGNINIGTLDGDDADFNYEYQKIRNHSFHSVLFDITAQMEFNFLPYETGSEKDFFTSYVALGGTFLIASSSTYPYQPAIPMSVGLKFNITERLSAGIEWSFRRTFTDYIDGTSGLSDIPLNQYISPDQINNYKQRGYIHNVDWYSFCGIFVTYKFYYSGAECSYYDSF